MKNALNLYMPPADRAKLDALAERLETKGVDISDQRGNRSYSALVRWLVQHTLDAMETHETENPAE